MKGIWKGKLFLFLLDVGFFSIHYYRLGTNLVKVGGTGLFACQLAKNIFKAGKVITTVSTAKVPKVKELLGEGIVDESERPPCRIHTAR